jgi:hypothetical protein
LWYFVEFNRAVKNAGVEARFEARIYADVDIGRRGRIGIRLTVDALVTITRKMVTFRYSSSPVFGEQ